MGKLSLHSRLALAQHGEATVCSCELVLINQSQMEHG